MIRSTHPMVPVLVPSWRILATWQPGPACISSSATSWFFSSLRQNCTALRSLASTKTCEEWMPKKCWTSGFQQTTRILQRIHTHIYIYIDLVVGVHKEVPVPDLTRHTLSCSWVSASPFPWSRQSGCTAGSLVDAQKGALWARSNRVKRQLHVIATWRNEKHSCMRQLASTIYIYIYIYSNTIHTYLYIYRQQSGLHFKPAPRPASGFTCSVFTSAVMPETPPAAIVLIRVVFPAPLRPTCGHWAGSGAKL